MPGMPEISEMMMDELKIKTNAIMKKVALNPSVYWGHTYVTTQKDPDTGEPLFIGDLGDWLNWCNEFTLDKGYGVVPAMIVGRPSFYTYLRQQRIATPQQGNIIPLNQRRADNE